MLHVAYRKDIEKWGETMTKEEKEKEEAAKKRIQAEFKKELGILVDMPKQGFGSTNDGNTARTLFRAFEISARILQIDSRIVEGLHDLCTMLNSNEKIDKTKFKEFCDDFLDLYCSLYKFYPIPTSLHRILVHGPEIIDSFALPIGQLSEQALEASHKHFKKFRRDHSRKFSRYSTNQDILNWLLLSTDPLINSNRKYYKGKKVVYSARVRDILNIDDSNDDDDEDDRADE